MSCPTLRCALTLLAAATPLAAQQRPVVDLSPGMSTYTDARISPDGTRVAFRVSGALGVVPIAGGPQVTIATGSSFGSYRWSANSLAVYYVDSSSGSNRVVSASRTGSGRTTIATVPGQTVELFDVDSTDSLLYGVRYDAGAQMHHLFSLSVSGGVVTDLVSRQERMSQVKIDPSDAWLTFAQQGNQPFDPVSIMRCQADGSNVSDILGQPLGVLVEGLDWIDQGDTVVCAGNAPSGSVQVMRIDRRTQAIEELTTGATHRRVSVSADGSWLVCESIDALGGNGPALIPIDGGGVVELFMRTRYQYSGTPTAGGPDNTVVFSANRPVANPGENPRIWKIELDDELRIAPRAGLGVPVTFELPLAANEVGGLLLGQRNAPITLSGISYDFDLGANFAILTLGLPTNGVLSLTVPIPPAPALQGQRLDFQGLRFDPSTNMGEWTRMVGLPIF